MLETFFRIELDNYQSMDIAEMGNIYGSGQDSDTLEAIDKFVAYVQINYVHVKSLEHLLRIRDRYVRLGRISDFESQVAQDLVDFAISTA